MIRRFAAGVGVALALAGGVFLSIGRTPPIVTASVGKRGCDLVITSPAGGATKTTRLRSGDSLTVRLDGLARRCPAATVTLTKSVADAGEVALGTTVTDGGAWTYSFTAADHVQTLVLARMTAGSITTEARATVQAETGLPKVVVTAPAGDDWGVLRVVASREDAGCGSGGNSHVDDGELGWLADVGCADGGQVLPIVVVTGAIDGGFVVTYDGVQLAAIAHLTSSPQTLTSADLGVLTLPEFSRADLTFTAENATGSTSVTRMVRVMTVAPPPPTGPDGGAWVARLVHARHADVDVDYVLPTVPAGVRDAHIEGAWTTTQALNGSGTFPDGGAWTYLTSIARSTVNVTTTPTAIADPPTVRRGTVNFFPCTQDGGVAPVLWCDFSPDVTPDSGVRIEAFRVTDGGTCTGASTFPGQFASFNPWRKFIVSTDADGGTASASTQPVDQTCRGIVAPVRSLYCVTESGSLNVTASETDFCEEYRDKGWLRNPRLLHYPSATTANESGVRQDCVLTDPDAVPQEWDCQGVVAHSGDVRSFPFRGLPPINIYFFELKTVY